jgi:hypothetical protein
MTKSGEIPQSEIDQGGQESNRTLERIAADAEQRRKRAVKLTRERRDETETPEQRLIRLRTGG